MLAVLIGAPTRGLVGVDVDLAKMTALVRSRGGEPVVLPHATLPAIRNALTALVDRCTADDAVLLYLTGHGSALLNSEYDPKALLPAPSRLSYFVPVATQTDDLLFDLELSLWCARLARKTRNVTALLDCCHSGTLVRGETADASRDPARSLAAFQAWRTAHQDEIDALDVEAHPDVVRLAGAGIDGFAWASTNGSALTTALVAELSTPAAADASWVALFAALERRLAFAGVSLEPRLSGPVRRRIFSLAEAMPPGALAVRREQDRLILEAGAEQGVRRGDLFLLATNGATRVYPIDTLEPTRATLRSRGGQLPDALPPGAFVLPLHLQGHGGVVVEGAETVTRPLTRALTQAHWDVWSRARQSHAVATLACTAATIAVHDPEGHVCATLDADDTHGCIAALQRLARGARLRHLGPRGLSSLRVRAGWGRVRDGVCEELPAREAVLDPDAAIYVRLQNEGQRRRFVSVFWLTDDGEAMLLSRSESMGIELPPDTTHVLGARPFARRPRGVLLPRRPLAPGERRRERLVLVATPHRQALWSFESTRPGGAVHRGADGPCVELFEFIIMSTEPAP